MLSGSNTTTWQRDSTPYHHWAGALSMLGGYAKAVPFCTEMVIEPDQPAQQEFRLNSVHRMLPI
jgi:hypothetical protein